MSNRVVASVRKNAREEIRVFFEEYHGDQLVSIRLGFEAKDRSIRASNKGLNIRIELLPELAAALAQVVDEARAESLIEAGPLAADLAPRAQHGFQR